MATLMVTKSLIFANPVNLSLRRHHPSSPRTVNLSPNLVPFFRISPKPLFLNNKTLVSKFSISSSLSTSPTTTAAKNNNLSSSSTVVFTDSTRTISTIATLAFAAATVVVKSLWKASAQVLASDSVRTLGPLFMASSIRGRPSGYLNTPLTVVAAGISKWLDIYSGVLMVRVLLSWFPNIPWDRQPLSAIRDLCDPYLNLFRNIIPPIFDTLDVSPLLAFAVLGVLGSVLTNSRGVY